MSMTVTEHGRQTEVWTQVMPDDRYTDANVKGVECAYVRPCGIAPDGFSIPRDLVQPLLDEGLIWLNEPPENDEPEKLWDLGVTGDGREETRNLRTIEDRIQAAFLRRVDLQRAADGVCKMCGRKVEQPGRDGVWIDGLLYHWQHSPQGLKAGADPTCEQCVQIGTGFGPNHKASSRCESGGRAHCTCDTCF